LRRPDRSAHQQNKPDAIFAVNELFAVTAIKAAKKLGLKVPEDISVIGFTDGIISKYSSPSITTVSQNGIKMGNKAAQMLIERSSLRTKKKNITRPKSSRRTWSSENLRQRCSFVKQLKING
jgi:DNA-binding LacI/PurR family transcriptional regulator